MSYYNIIHFCQALVVMGTSLGSHFPCILQRDALGAVLFVTVEHLRSNF